MRRFFEQKLNDTFKGRDSFTKKDLEDFFRLNEPDLNEHTLKSRIYHLKNKKIITQLNRTNYTLSSKKVFMPAIDTELADLAILIMDFIPDEQYCIWNSSWVNQFSRHQTMKNFYIVEAGKEELSSLFHFFKDKGLENVFLNPEQETLYLYARENEVPIILKPLISRAPVKEEKYNSKTIFVPSLEKLLVDLYTDVLLFNYTQGAELETVFENAISKYAVNFTTLFAYARRRNKAEQLEKYLKTHFFHLLKSIAI